MQQELREGRFLIVDGEQDRDEAYARLRAGTVELKQMEAEENGHPIEASGAMINDWVGVLFIPHATLAQTLAVVEDYDNYQKYYKPGMRHSRLLHRDGDEFQAALQFYKKSLLTVVMNAEFDIRYETVGADRVVSRSRSNVWPRCRMRARPMSAN